MDQFTVHTREELEELAEAKHRETFADPRIQALKESKFACQMELDYGQLEIGHLIGRIPMFSFDPKPSFEHLPEAEEMLKKIAKEAKMHIPQSRLTGENNVVRTSLICAMYSYPKEDPRNQYVVLASSIILAFYYLDDETCGDMLFATVNEIEDVISAWADITTNIWKGKYATFEEIPPVAATFEAVVRLFWLVCNKFGNILPPEADSKYSRKGFKSAIRSTTAMRIEALGHHCSANLYLKLRSDDSGVPLLIDASANALKDGKRIEPEVRKHILFKKLVTTCGEESGISNDLVSFIKELGENDMYYNYVIRNVEIDGMSFYDSFHHTIKVITQLRGDILLLMEQLQEEFPENETLVELLIMIKQMLDANVYVSLIAPRYGGMKATEVPL